MRPLGSRSVSPQRRVFQPPAMPPVMQKAQQRIAGQHPRAQAEPVRESIREPEDQRIAPAIVSPHVEALREQNELLRQQNEILMAIVDRLDQMMSPERIVQTVQGIGAFAQAMDAVGGDGEVVEAAAAEAPAEPERSDLPIG
jgi:hypothetical protein